MGYQEAKKENYTFDKLPGNIRQMGEQPEERVYIEDYVVTYMHQIFRKKAENAIVILIGKKGEKEAAEMSFVYGALEVEIRLRDGIRAFEGEMWDKVYELLGKHFQGAQVLGWGCGVNMWDSSMEETLQQVQKKYFKQEGQIFFRENLSEKEEKIWKWQNGALWELPGYVIYYDKNPQMQEYMLIGQPKKSFEAGYQDKVTANVRQAVQHKERRAEPKKIAVYSAGLLLFLFTILGANLLIQSTKKIDHLEKTIATLSDAAVEMTKNPKKATAEKEKKEVEIPSEKAMSVMGEGTEETAKETEAPAENSLLTESVKATEAPKALEKLVTAEPKKKVSDVQSNKKSNKAKSTPMPKEEALQEQPVISSKTESYIVRAGDTLSQIVWRQYHTLSCLDMVKRVNKIENGDKILEGQTILLPEYIEK